MRRDRLDGGERVLHPVVQLVHEELAVLLGLAPLGDLPLRRLVEPGVAQGLRDRLAAAGKKPKVIIVAVIPLRICPA